jgi:hypothetical protein
MYQSSFQFWYNTVLNHRNTRMTCTCMEFASPHSATAMLKWAHDSPLHFHPNSYTRVQGNMFVKTSLQAGM